MGGRGGRLKPSELKRPKVIKILGPLDLSWTEKKMFKKLGVKGYYAILGRGTQGAYSPDKNMIFLKKNPISRRDTLNHEYGHAKDYVQPGARHSNKAKFGKLYKKHWKDIVVDRYNENVKKKYRVKDIKGVRDMVSKDYFKYMTGKREVFAEAYSKYTTRGAGFKKKFNDLASYFKSLKI